MPTVLRQRPQGNPVSVRIRNWNAAMVPQRPQEGRAAGETQRWQKSLSMAKQALVNGLRLSWKFYIESCLLGKSLGQFMGVSFISKPPAIYLIKKA
jgi:hypothetical protein